MPPSYKRRCRDKDLTSVFFREQGDVFQCKYVFHQDYQHFRNATYFEPDVKRGLLGEVPVELGSEGMMDHLRKAHGLSKVENLYLKMLDILGPECINDVIEIRDPTNELGSYDSVDLP